MLIIRPVENRDLDDLYQLALKAGKGLTSLPPCHDTLARKITLSIESFNRSNSHPDDCFLLVMVDMKRDKVVGTAAVYGKTGTRQAFYAYRVMSVTHHSHSLNRQIRSEMLHLSNDYTDCAEVGTLFLDPSYRGNGHWLSRSRYILMGQHPDRFAPYVIAEMRGWLDDEGNSPFWNAIGQQFFDMSFAEADHLSGIGSNQFITELMPKHPIYTCMLPKEAKDVLGKPQRDTIRAVELLEAEGFEYDNMIDIFDGGPILRGRVNRLSSVLNRLDKIVEDTPLEKSEPIHCIVSNSALSDFRVAYLETTANENHIYLNHMNRELLKLQKGEIAHLLIRD